MNTFLYTDISGIVDYTGQQQIIDAANEISEVTSVVPFDINIRAIVTPEEYLENLICGGGTDLRIALTDMISIINAEVQHQDVSYSDLSFVIASDFYDRTFGSAADFMRIARPLFDALGCTLIALEVRDGKITKFT